MNIEASVQKHALRYGDWARVVRASNWLDGTPMSVTAESTSYDGKTWSPPLFTLPSKPLNRSDSMVMLEMTRAVENRWEEVFGANK